MDKAHLREPGPCLSCSQLKRVSYLISYSTVCYRTDNDWILRNEHTHTEQGGLEELLYWIACIASFSHGQGMIQTTKLCCCRFLEILFSNPSDVRDFTLNCPHICKCIFSYIKARNFLKQWKWKFSASFLCRFPGLASNTYSPIEDLFPKGLVYKSCKWF